MATTAEGAIRLYSGATVETSLSSDISAAATTLTVADANTYPSPSTDQFFAITIDLDGPNEEVVWVGSKNGQNFQNCLRGQDGTVARTHRAGETIRHTSTALDFREANKHVNEKSPAYVPHEQLVHKSVAQTITANHTVSGSWDMAAVSIDDLEAASIDAETAALKTITGDTEFTGKIKYRANPDAPKKVATTTGNAGTSDVPMRSDAIIPFDARALLRATTPAGTIIPWAGSALPAEEGHDGEWFWADGSALDGSKYTAYKANIGTLYGGTASAPRLPNVAGRVLVGVDAAHGMGNTGGSRDVILGVPNLPRHSLTIQDPGHKTPVGGDDGQRVVVTAPNTNLRLPAEGTASGIPLAIAALDKVATGITRTDEIGSNTAFNVEQPWIGMRYIVKVH